MRFRQLFENPAETVGLIFGRFNPPHKGHKAAWEMASGNDHWYVGTNQNTQGPKDPLPYDVKIKAMEVVWPQVADHIVPHQSWLTLASEIYKRHGKSVLNVYTDEKWVLDALQQYNGVNKPEGHGYYDFIDIVPKQTPRLSSATALRDAVKAGDREAFAQAAGVPADLKIDGKEYFDLVAEYLMSYQKESVETDKYNKTLEGDIMNLNEMRKLAGLPLVEAAPVDYYGMSDEEKQLADIGRILMKKAESQKDEEFANALATVGNHLTMYGTIEGARNPEELARKTGYSLEVILKFMDFGKKVLDMQGTIQPKADDAEDSYYDDEDLVDEE